MNSRKPIYLIIACGLVVIAILTSVPYFTRAREAVANALALLPLSEKASGNAELKPAEARPSFDAASWYAGRGEATDTHGVLIETLDGKRVLASLNPDTTFNPASLIKLATSLAALKKLGANYRFQTKVFLDGDVNGKGKLQGRLFVQGSDPTFGDAGAGLIGKELRALGVESLSEIVVSPEFCFNFSNSPEDSAGRLAKALKLGNPKTAVASEQSGQQIMVVNSNPLSEILLYMNARSSNFMADRVGSLLGGANGVRQFLIDDLKLSPNDVMLQTVSGREHNGMTPRNLLKVIRALVEEAQRQELEPADIMPVASDDAGTLRRRLAGTGLEGAVVAKTGTLTAEVDGGMTSLAGIIYTEEQGVIVFAILARGNRIWDNRQLEDQLLTDVIKSHATPQIIAGPTPRRLLPSTNVIKGDK